MNPAAPPPPPKPPAPPCDVLYPAFGPLGFLARMALLVALASAALSLVACNAIGPLLPATGADLDKATKAVDDRSKERTDRLRADVAAAERERMLKQTEYLRSHPGDAEGAILAGTDAVLVRHEERKVASEKHETENPAPKPSATGTLTGGGGSDGTEGLPVWLQIVLTLAGGGGVGGVIAKVLDILQDRKPFVTSKGVHVPEAALGDAALAHLNGTPPAAPKV